MSVKALCLLLHQIEGFGLVLCLLNLKNPLCILGISHVLALILQTFSFSLTYLLTPLIVTFTKQTYKICFS